MTAIYQCMFSRVTKRSELLSVFAFGLHTVKLGHLGRVSTVHLLQLPCQFCVAITDILQLLLR